jgi:hypothetical protein
MRTFQSTISRACSRENASGDEHERAARVRDGNVHHARGDQAHNSEDDGNGELKLPSAAVRPHLFPLFTGLFLGFLDLPAGLTGDDERFVGFVGAPEAPPRVE